MARSALALVVALVLLCHAGYSLADDAMDPATHHAAPPATMHEHGHVERMAGLDVYVSGSPSTHKAVIMISDVFGFATPLFRKLADKVAAHGFYVIAPDYFRGDPLRNFTDLPNWIVKHLPAPEVETTNKLVHALKEKGITSVGLAGFCWGAKVAALTAKKDHIDAVVQAHPSLIEESDYAEVVVPISVLAAPEDGVEKYKALLKMRRKEDRVPTYVKIFTQVTHGWTIRYDETDKAAVKKANRAHRLLIKWFRKYL